MFTCPFLFHKFQSFGTVNIKFALFWMLVACDSGKEWTELELLLFDRSVLELPWAQVSSTTAPASTPGVCVCLCVCSIFMWLVELVFPLV